MLYCAGKSKGVNSEWTLNNNLSDNLITAHRLSRADVYPG